MTPDEHKCTGADCPYCNERGRQRANERLAVLTEEERKQFQADYRKWLDEKFPLRKDATDADAA